MGWKEIKERARGVVHSHLSVPAVYSSPDKLEEIVCDIRLHEERKMFGDLDREGFAKMIENVNQVIFDTAQVKPRRGGEVTIGIRTYTIDRVLPRDGRFQAAEVALK